MYEMENTFFLTFCSYFYLLKSLILSRESIAISRMISHRYYFLRVGVIIECPLNGLFHHARDFILTSQIIGLANHKNPHVYHWGAKCKCQFMDCILQKSTNFCWPMIFRLIFSDILWKFCQIIRFSLPNQGNYETLLAIFHISWIS